MRRILAAAAASASAIAMLAASPALAVTAAAPWTIQTVPPPAGSARNGLMSVSCPDTSDCVAVGMEKTGPPAAVVYSDGAWAETTLPSAPPLSSLTGVSCSSASACTAIGEVQTSGATFLIDRWDGTSWSAQTAPAPAGSSGAAFYGVSCPSATQCVAVGSYENGDLTEPLAEIWNGTAWRIQTVGNPDSLSGLSLASVSCAAVAHCVAVGAYQDGNLTATLAGGTWTAAAAPAPAGTEDGALSAVSCASATRCVAVGESIGTTDGPEALSLAGGTWTPSVPATPSGGSDLDITSISCPTVANCTATGLFRRGSPANALVEHWNGQSWKTQQSAAPIANKQLRGVSCPAVNACTAAGFDAPQHGPDESMLAETQQS